MLRELREDLRLAARRDRWAEEKLGLSLDGWQEELLRSGSRRVLLNCSRQSGKSTMAAVMALHRALHYRRSLVLCLAPALRQFQELFAKIAGFYRDLGDRPVPPAELGERRLSLELENGSRIITLPGSAKTIRGFSGAALLLVDEASRVDDGLPYAIRPMLAVSGGSLIMLSTPYGRRGVFFEEFSREPRGGQGPSGQGQGPSELRWERYEIPAGGCPRISASFLEEERRALPAWVYRQEYECSFEETEDQVFSHELVSAAITEEVTPLFEEAS